jgi:large subunit ribosomal protein L25
MALIRDVQWDHLGKEIIHLDFFRVSAEERVKTSVSLELHGTAPGLNEGGMLEQPVHALAITCLATSIPESIRIEVGNLHLNEAVHVKDLALPEGITTDVDPDLVLVHVVTRKAAATEVVEAQPSEPQLVGKSDKEKKEE